MNFYEINIHKSLIMNQLYKKRIEDATASILDVGCLLS